MQERLNDIRVRTSLNIFRLYPSWKQDGSANCKAWIDANKAHGQKLAADPEADIDLVGGEYGWPDPASWTPVEAPTQRKTNIEAAIEQNSTEQPPEAISDLFQADRPFAEQALALQQLWVKLGHQVQRGAASPEEIHKHERLSSEIEFINKHAFEGV